MGQFLGSPDEVGAVVLDFGTATCKAGFAGKDAPQSVFPTVILSFVTYFAVRPMFISLARCVVLCFQAVGLGATVDAV